jgi:hypothetical protein
MTHVARETGELFAFVALCELDGKENVCRLALAICHPLVILLTVFKTDVLFERTRQRYTCDKTTD